MRRKSPKPDIIRTIPQSYVSMRRGMESLLQYLESEQGADGVVRIADAHEHLSSYSIADRVAILNGLIKLGRVSLGDGGVIPGAGQLRSIYECAWVIHDGYPPALTQVGPKSASHWSRARIIGLGYYCISQTAIHDAQNAPDIMRRSAARRLCMATGKFPILVTDDAMEALGLYILDLLSSWATFLDIEP